MTVQTAQILIAGQWRDSAGSETFRAFDPVTGNVDVAAGTPAGSYSFDYQICERLNPTNCTTATIRVSVVANIVTGGRLPVSVRITP